jgi:hypothetical protein
MHAQLDDLLTATYVLIDDFLPKRRGPGRPPRITDAELITLAIAQVFMGLPNDRQFLALAGACASGSNRSFGPAKDSSASSATAPAHSRACAPASGCGSSPSPPGSGITPRSVNLAGASAPMATNSGSTI